MRPSIFAFLAGAAISAQAGLNAQLGVLLKSSFIGTAIAFFASSLFTMMAALVAGAHLPPMTMVKSVPFHLWFSGGALAAFGVGMYYFLIPKMGVGPMMSYALTGQIILAVIVSHFGWFDLPVKPINLRVIIGTLALSIGVLLINFDK